MPPRSVRARWATAAIAATAVAVLALGLSVTRFVETPQAAASQHCDTMVKPQHRTSDNPNGQFGLRATYSNTALALYDGLNPVYNHLRVKVGPQSVGEGDCRAESVQVQWRLTADPAPEWVNTGCQETYGIGVDADGNIVTNTAGNLDRTHHDPYDFQHALTVTSGCIHWSFWNADDSNVSTYSATVKIRGRADTAQAWDTHAESLAAGTEFDVRIRICRSEINETDVCSEWSDPLTETLDAGPSGM